jgi:hypothetical protein
MCDGQYDTSGGRSAKTVPLSEAVGMVLAHDITEIRKDEFKGPAFRKGHVIRADDVCHLQRLGKERLFILSLCEDEMHEDEAAYSLAQALMGEGVGIGGEPKEGKLSIVAARDGLLRVNKDALYAFNMLGEVMCATLHDNTVVRRGQTVAETRAIPLVIRRGGRGEADAEAQGRRRNHGKRGVLREDRGCLCTGYPEEDRGVRRYGGRGLLCPGR